MPDKISSRYYYDCKKIITTIIMTETNISYMNRWYYNHSKIYTITCTITEINISLLLLRQQTNHNCCYYDRKKNSISIIITTEKISPTTITIKKKYHCYYYYGIKNIATSNIITAKDISLMVFKNVATAIIMKQKKILPLAVVMLKTLPLIS